MFPAPRATTCFDPTYASAPTLGALASPRYIRNYMRFSFVLSPFPFYPPVHVPYRIYNPFLLLAKPRNG
jgi:hypothetical protein